MQQLIPGDGFAAPTLRRVWIDYQQTRQLSPVTVRNYNHRLNFYLKDWLDLPVTSITEEMCEERHKEIAGNASANSTFRTLRALLHYAAIKYRDADNKRCLDSNPVRRLSDLRQWRREKRKTRIIQLAQYPAFVRGVFQHDSILSRDFLLLLFFTGFRKGEAEELKWEHVDLKSGIIHLLDTKNGEDYQIPMSSYVWNLLKLRQFGANSPWVFPSPISKKDHVTCGEWMYKPVVQRSGVIFSPHDIRRSFISLADELEIKSQVVKALVNHKDDDITERYTIRSIERLRRATQRITDAIIHYSGLR